MTLIHSVEELRAELQKWRETAPPDHTLGLVPTMGALHEGHLSLVRRSIVDNGLTVVSIFVNPTQFNDPRDLDTYPRTLDADMQLLDSLGGRLIVFAPGVADMYPTPDTRTFSYPPTDQVMEGSRRPGHFNGVCQIVSKLFDIVSPDNAYFGEKDFQQIAVIRAMAAHIFAHTPLTIHACPIVREASGLALSSRNSRLTPTERAHAALIHATLAQSTTWGESVEATRRRVIDTLNSDEDFEVEYFEIVDGHTLATISSWSDTPYAVGCITVYTGADRVRLIDNITYKTA